MKYQINIDSSIQTEVHRIANELIKKAISNSKNEKIKTHEKIHEVRKICKRMRGLLRIVRPNLSLNYKTENIFYRNLGRNLSAVRDKQVLIESLEYQYVHSFNTSCSSEIESILIKLKEDAKTINEAKLILEFQEDIAANKNRITGWAINKEGFKSLKGGIRKTYRCGKIAMEESINLPTAENYHEWRKQVKYHYFHMELLTQIWPKFMKTYVEQVYHLSELLGKDHDLCLLEEKVTSNSEFNFTPETQASIISVIDSEQNKLREGIKRLGSKIYSEPPNQLVNRLEGYWNSCLF